MTPTVKKTNSGEIKFKRGFRKRTKKEIIDILKESLGKKHNNPKQNDELIRLVEIVPLVSNPLNDQDWLAQYNEPGQTCFQFLRHMPYEPKIEDRKKYIYYIQIGGFESTKLDFASLIEYSRCFFSSESIKLMPLKIELHKTNEKQNGETIKMNALYGDKVRRVTCRLNKKTKHLQLKAQSIFSLLKLIKPHDAHCLIGFSETDLYVDDSDLFVAGLCDGSLRVGMFSCFRYNPTLSYSEEFWFKVQLKKKIQMDQGLLATRSAKLLVHETCHLLGFEHCVYMDCCMNGKYICIFMI
jgi:archaemetzincin